MPKSRGRERRRRARNTSVMSAGSAPNKGRVKSGGVPQPKTVSPEGLADPGFELSQNLADPAKVAKYLTRYHEYKPDFLKFNSPADTARSGEAEAAAGAGSGVGVIVVPSEADPTDNIAFKQCQLQKSELLTISSVAVNEDDFHPTTIALLEYLTAKLAKFEFNGLLAKKVALHGNATRLKDLPRVFDVSFTLILDMDKHVGVFDFRMRELLEELMTQFGFVCSSKAEYTKVCVHYDKIEFKNWDELAVDYRADHHSSFMFSLAILKSKRTENDKVLDVLMDGLIKKAMNTCGITCQASMLTLQSDGSYRVMRYGAYAIVLPTNETILTPGFAAIVECLDSAPDVLLYPEFQEFWNRFLTDPTVYILPSSGRDQRVSVLRLLVTRNGKDYTEPYFERLKAACAAVPVDGQRRYLTLTELVLSCVIITDSDHWPLLFTDPGVTSQIAHSLDVLYRFYMERTGKANTDRLYLSGDSAICQYFQLLPKAEAVERKTKAVVLAYTKMLWAAHCVVQNIKVNCKNTLFYADLLYYTASYVCSSMLPKGASDKSREVIMLKAAMKRVSDTWQKLDHVTVKDAVYGSGQSGLYCVLEKFIHSAVSAKVEIEPLVYFIWLVY